MKRNWKVKLMDTLPGDCNMSVLSAFLSFVKEYEDYIVSVVDKSAEFHKENYNYLIGSNGDQKQIDILIRTLVEYIKRGIREEYADTKIE